MLDEDPDADTLLAARVEDGWTPTATATVDGDVIMGHATCRFATDEP